MSAKDTMENKITEGVIWKQLLLFFFPILVGTSGGLSEKRHYPASAVRPVRSSIWWSDFLPDYLPAQQL